MTLLEFADYLEQKKPSPVQMEMNPETNRIILKTLEWIIKEARSIAKKS